ncbi:hypothetical protein ACWGB8_20085 [Kitasatospora sp. NPDC054939]
MTGDPFDDRPWADDGGLEQELRVLLHRAAPELPAPDDRMDRVLARADRTRRRRRTAALTGGLTAGLAAAVLASAPATAPGPPPGALRSVPAAAPSATETAVPPTPTRSIRFPDLNLTVAVPVDWYRTLRAGWDDSRTTLYLASQPLSDKAACSPPLDALCASAAPLAESGAGPLAEDGVLVSVRVDPGRIIGDTPAPLRPGVMTELPVDKSCALHRGTRFLRGERTDLPVKAPVRVEACLNDPSPATVAQVQALLDSLLPASEPEVATPSPTDPTGPGAPSSGP